MYEKEEGRSLTSSKTIWLGTVVLLIGALFQTEPGQELLTLLPEDIQNWILMIVGLLTYAVRFFTDKPLALKEKVKSALLDK